MINETNFLNEFEMQKQKMLNNMEVLQQSLKDKKIIYSDYIVLYYTYVHELQKFGIIY